MRTAQTSSSGRIRSDPGRATRCSWIRTRSALAARGGRRVVRVLFESARYRQGSARRSPLTARTVPPRNGLRGGPTLVPGATRFIPPPELRWRHSGRTVRSSESCAFDRGLRPASLRAVEDEFLTVADIARILKLNQQTGLCGIRLVFAYCVRWRGVRSSHNQSALTRTTSVPETAGFRSKKDPTNVQLSAGATERSGLLFRCKPEPEVG